VSRPFWSGRLSEDMGSILPPPARSSQHEACFVLSTKQYACLYRDFNKANCLSEAVPSPLSGAFAAGAQASGVEPSPPADVPAENAPDRQSHSDSDKIQLSGGAAMAGQQIRAICATYLGGLLCCHRLCALASRQHRSGLPDCKIMVSRDPRLTKLLSRALKQRLG
jgi:hypothetical protein